MKVGGEPRRTIWPAPGRDGVHVIDQRLLPHRVAIERLDTVAQVHDAIRGMVVRGAPLIGVTAAYGMALQAGTDASDAALARAEALLNAARPTAVNLSWATRRMRRRLLRLPTGERADAAWHEAGAMADADVAVNQSIARHGLAWLKSLPRRRQDGVLNLLTHCNAGWLATVDWGTALAPIYLAHREGLAVHVWVDETRPRNQGASLTAWELAQEGIAHTVIADNAGGHLMQHGAVDAVIVGADRVSAWGDVCNKIGTYLKALAAHDCGVPFAVAVPLSTLDRSLGDGLHEIPIEERAMRELTHLTGRDSAGAMVEVQLVPDGTRAANPAFDVTPARLVGALVTEAGVVPATAEAIAALPMEQADD